MKLWSIAPTERSIESCAIHALALPRLMSEEEVDGLLQVVFMPLHRQCRQSGRRTAPGQRRPRELRHYMRSTANDILQRAVKGNTFGSSTAASAFANLELPVSKVTPDNHISAR